MSHILVVDDEQGIRQVLSDVLHDEGYGVTAAEDGYQALQALQNESIDLVILDVWLPNMGGIDVLKAIKKEHPEIEVIIISGHANINMAVQAVKIGAFDFLEKPLSLDKTITAVHNALKLEELRKENRNLRQSLYVEDRMVGGSEGLRKVQALIEQSAGSDARILILGENGTGKELVAREIHRRSYRSAGPFVEINCASIPETLIESELFGHEKGSFTNAVARRRGKFELADGGTLFLDEIADMSLATQAKVLRVIQELKFERVGGEQSIGVDVRLVAATNRNIEEEVRAGRFREDLYFRINVVPIYVPPLRERLEDLEELLDYFMNKLKAAPEAEPKRLSPEALRLLRAHPWPGNIRELKNFVERVNIMAEEQEISAETVRRYLSSRTEPEPEEPQKDYASMKLTQAKEEFERDLLVRKLEEHGGNITKASRALGISPSHLHNKIRKYGIDPKK
ncbi:MAG: sigma-54-dependent Fis family transcriptional regulator [Spirochaetales bacterium]|nr:sigma-54-dependent Fis family transcriptional regulator [Spirochaetales bacterium]